MKACDITKLTAELKRDNVQYINRNTLLIVFVGVATGNTNAVKLIYRTRIGGRRQVTVRFMNYENFAKSLKVVQGHCKCHHSTDRIQVPIRLPL